MPPEKDSVEEAAELEHAAIEAMAALVEDHNYNEAELRMLVDAAF